MTRMNIKISFTAISILLIFIILPVLRANINQRRIGIGSKIPEFTTSDIYGNSLNYRHGNGKVLVAIFLSTKQKHSNKAAMDIKRIMSKLRSHTKRLSVVVAVDDPNDLPFAIHDPNIPDPNQPGIDINIVTDKERKLWGIFGIIATPTVIISDTNDTVLWVKAGHGYDFAPVVQARLNQALGIEQQIDPNEAGLVKTVTNATTAARIKRHIQMAKMLQEKGRTESAVTQMKIARELDPNSVELALEMSSLLCSIGKGNVALEILEGVKAGGNIEKSKLLTITGWAKRQMKNFEEAEKVLLEATKLNPNESRAFFELGRIYQARGDKDKAMEAYYHALLLIFGNY